MKGPTSRRLLIILWVGLAAVGICLWYFPLVSSIGRLVLLMVMVLLVVDSLVLVWTRRTLRWGLLAFCAVAMGFILFPSGPGKDLADLRALYRKALLSYSGCPYVWGGEGRFGIDCSGLVRRGLEDAFVTHGFCTLNPYWIRQGISLWWHDATAQVLGQGYGGRTREVTGGQKLNELDPSLLMPGDLAVTMSGIHVMAYLGDKTWIGADPEEERVTTFAVPNKNGYFSSPMRIMRWTVLDDK